MPSVLRHLSTSTLLLKQVPELFGLPVGICISKKKCVPQLSSCPWGLSSSRQSLLQGPSHDQHLCCSSSLYPSYPSCPWGNCSLEMLLAIVHETAKLCMSGRTSLRDRDGSGGTRGATSSRGFLEGWDSHGDSETMLLLSFLPSPPLLIGPSCRHWTSTTLTMAAFISSELEPRASRKTSLILEARQSVRHLPVAPTSIVLIW